MGIYFQGTPWALPLTASALALFTVLSRRLLLSGPDRVVAVLWATTLVGFLSVTATPAHGYRPWSSDRNFSGGVHVPGWSELFSLSETSLNVWLTVPLGFLSLMVFCRK
jgi:hypothetical protein